MKSRDELYSMALEAPVERAYRNDINLLKGGVPAFSIVQDLNRLDVSSAMGRLPVNQDSYAQFYDSLVDAYRKSGRDAEKAARRLSRDARFSMQEYTIKRFIEQNVEESIRAMARTQKQSIADIMQQRLAEGASSKKIVAELLGKRMGDSWVGGLIGLTGNGIKASENARKQLENLDHRYFDRKLLDARDNKLIERAIREGRPLTQVQIDRIIGRYQAQLLKARAKALALTEVTTAINRTQLDTFIKAANMAGVPLDLLQKTWQSVGDSHVRLTHRLLSGKSVSLAEKFVSAAGHFMDCPGDPSAPYEERAGCRCRMRIKWMKPESRK